MNKSYIFIFYTFQYRLKGDKHVELTLAWLGDKKEVKSFSDYLW